MKKIQFYWMVDFQRQHLECLLLQYLQKWQIRYISIYSHYYQQLKRLRHDRQYQQWRCCAMGGHIDSFYCMEVFSRRNRCMSAMEPIKPPKLLLSRSCSLQPSNKSIPPLSFTTDCSRVVCERKPAAPGQGRYNKWFIPPSHRLKRSVPSIKLDKSSDDFYYRQLFRAGYPDPENPFQHVPSDKLAKFQKIPRKGICLIEQFRRCQLVRRRRVPQIVEMLFDHVAQKQVK